MPSYENLTLFGIVEAGDKLEDSALPRTVRPHNYLYKMSHLLYELKDDHIHITVLEGD